MSSRQAPARPLDASPASSAALAQFAADVEYYLLQSPRQLPSRYLYDDLGSALFEAICRLPWYGVTRAEAQLLSAHAPAIWRAIDTLTTVVELGSGSGEKLRTLIEGDARSRHLTAHLIDVSPSALEQSIRTLAPLAQVRVVPHLATYDAGLANVARERSSSGHTMVLFLGSNIGNFDPPNASALVGAIRSALRVGDALLLGADLVKPESDLQAAYADPLGVTAAFNLNLLVRINRELHGTFDVAQFAHRAIWNADESRVEMHLVSRRAQAIDVPAANLGFRMQADEPIWTESSYKYEPEQIVSLLEAAGFAATAQWVDPVSRFALTLARAI